jgi:2'-5' RNA ligase
MRLFTCTYLSVDNQAFYDEHVARLVGASQGLLRPIPQLSAHLTYAFLPSVSETEYERIVEAIGAIEHPAPIAIRLGHPTVLYARKQARLVCVDVLDGQSELGTLAASVNEALRRACPVTRVDTLKSLHVTLARFRRDAIRRDGEVVEGVLRSSELALERRDMVSEIHVVESHLTPAGPVYTLRHRRIVGAP